MSETKVLMAAPECLKEPLVVPQKLLMGPGPSNAPKRVLDANALPMLGHLHPEFIQIMNDVQEGLRYLFQTENKLTFAISGTGHAAMEAACCNLVEEGDVVMTAVNGIWGERFGDMAERHGAIVRPITKPMGEVFSLEDIEKGLTEHKPSLMFITHGESSGTTLQPLEGVADLCHAHGCLLIVDMVASLGGAPVRVDDWGIDVAYSGSQKVISAPPGVSPITFNDSAWQRIKNRKTKVRSFYFDVNWLANYWGCDGETRRYHHTGPISNMYALREGIAILVEEGLNASWGRHAKCAEELHAGLEDLGLNLLVSTKSARLPTVTGVRVPAGTDWKAVAAHMMKNHRVEVSGGLGDLAGQIWRVGLMGHNATSENVKLMLKAMKEAMSTCSDKSRRKLMSKY